MSQTPVPLFVIPALRRVVKVRCFSPTGCLLLADTVLRLKKQNILIIYVHYYMFIIICSLLYVHSYMFNIIYVHYYMFLIICSLLFVHYYMFIIICSLLYVHSYMFNIISSLLYLHYYIFISLFKVINKKNHKYDS